MYTTADFLNLFFQRIRLYVSESRRWRKKSQSIFFNDVTVHYLRKNNSTQSGGGVKVRDLERWFPDNKQSPSIFYVVSSVLGPNDDIQVLKAKKQGLKVVVNQNGVAYPAWQKRGWRFSNRVLKKVLHLADYVFYQSEFSRMASDTFLGAPRCKSQVLHNVVDTSFFLPGPKEANNEEVNVLVAGSHGQFYRVKSAIDTLALIHHTRPKVKLYIAGRFNWNRNQEEARRDIEDYVSAVSLDSQVVILGAYKQEEFPHILQNMKVLLHPKYNDNCPRLVLEAMSCGVPVVYSCSGGVPELVGKDCGIGIFAPPSWEKTYNPTAIDMAEATLKILKEHKKFSISARQRAVHSFDIKPWIETHQAVFSDLVGC